MKRQLQVFFTIARQLTEKSVKVFKRKRCIITAFLLQKHVRDSQLLQLKVGTF